MCGNTVDFCFPLLQATIEGEEEGKIVNHARQELGNLG